MMESIIRKEIPMTAPSESESYDGETACKYCGVIVCAYCQGKDYECPNIHAVDCRLSPGNRTTGTPLADESAETRT